MVDRSDGELVAAALQGDAEAYMQLCRRHYPSAAAVGLSILHDEQLAEDVAQESFAKAVQMLPTLRKASQFRPWLMSICRNMARTAARRQRRMEPLDDRDLPDPKSQGQDAAEAVREAIDRLPADAREVILLRYQANLSYSELATALGLSEQAVNGRLRRAKEAIRQLLRQAGMRGAR